MEPGAEFEWESVREFTRTTTIGLAATAPFDQEIHPFGLGRAASKMPSHRKWRSQSVIKVFIVRSAFVFPFFGAFSLRFSMPEERIASHSLPIEINSATRNDKTENHCRCKHQKHSTSANILP